MNDETQTVTVHWSEQTWKRSTIKVGKDEKEEEIIRKAISNLDTIMIDKDIMWETVNVDKE